MNFNGKRFRGDHEFVVMEYGLFEWVYVNGKLRWKQYNHTVDDMVFHELLDMLCVDHSYVDLNEVPGQTHPDHDGCFWMIDDPPHDIKNIDHRINEAMVYVTFTQNTKEN